MEPPPLSNTMGPMPGTLERPIQGPKKRLIMTCDGTWLNQDNSIQNGKLLPPSNVSRIGWAIKETSRDGIPQIVNYQHGVGTDGGVLNKVIGGATGQGLKENVREAYSYVATNWREGDEIFLIGFSRGAFTARSVGGMIGELGLLTRKGLPYFNEIFEDFAHRHSPDYVSKFPNAPFSKKPPFGPEYVNELVRRGMSRVRIPIKAICCFDTVGSLGIPKSPTPMGSFFRGTRERNEYQFYDTTLNPCVENAFQALGLDEHRAAFSPALWEKRKDNTTTNLKQVWFPGVHSNIGGGYDDQEIANITLSWMMSRLEPFLDFRSDYLISAHEQNVDYYRSLREKPRPWSFGEIYNSMIGVYRLGGRTIRTPGDYFRTDPNNGRPTTKRLTNTNEYIHASVRTRLGLQGPGVSDRGIYEPEALRDWTWDVEQGANGQGGNMRDGGLVVWNYRGNDRGGQHRIPEAVLLETELALLRQSTKAYAFIQEGKAPRSSRRSRRMEPTASGALNGDAPMDDSGDRRRSRRSVNPPDERESRRKSRRSVYGDPRDDGGDNLAPRESRRRSRRYDDDDDGDRY